MTKVLEFIGRICILFVWFELVIVCFAIPFLPIILKLFFDVESETSAYIILLIATPLFWTVGSALGISFIKQIKLQMED